MKIWNYLVIITGVSLVLALGGLPVAGISELLNIIGISTTSTGFGFVTTDNTFWNFIFGGAGLLVAAITTGGIGIGTFVYTKDKSFLMIPVITSVSFYWLSALISIINYVKDEPIFGIILGLILLPLTVGFIQSCVDWFLGID